MLTFFKKYKVMKDLNKILMYVHVIYYIYLTANRNLLSFTQKL